jgi:FKBP-type peptidyl-prolyl cis-trans isomerase
MNFNKLTKVTAILATSLFVTTSLFAAGTKEIAPSSTIAMIENIDSNANTYSFQVLSSTDEFDFTIDNESSSSVYDLESYQVGDYIEISGLEDGNAASIRYITPLVVSGMIDFIPTSPQIDVPLNDYGFDNNLEQSVNYSYGQLIQQNFVAQNTFVDASYFTKGIIDASMMDDADYTALYDMDQMQQIYEDYSAAVQADNTILPTEFGEDIDLMAVKSLGMSDDMAQKFAYTYGYMFAANFAQSGFPLDAEYLSEGFLDSAFAHDSQISEYQQQNAIRDFEAQFTAQQAAAAAKLAEDNLNAANQFLATNKTNADVITLEDGLQYKVLVAADGAMPVDTDTVTLNYELSTPTGQVLDSSYQRGTPTQFPLSGVIPGFKEAVENMHVGETIIAWVHPDLGYGVDGNTSVEPNTLLTFKIELISIDQVSEEATN